MCGETVEDECDSLLMPVCGSVGGGGSSGSRMGYHGNILLKTNAGEGEAEMEGLYSGKGIRGGGGGVGRRATDRSSNLVHSVEFALWR